MCPENNITATFIKNPFDPDRSALSVPLEHTGQCAIDYVRSMIGQIYAEEVLISINGAMAEAGDKPGPGAHLSFCQVQRGGGGGKDILRTVAMLALMATAPQLVGVMAGVGWGAVGAGYALTTTGWMMAGAITMGGAYLVNTILPVPTARVGKFNPPDFDKSNNYGWNPPANGWQEGTALTSLIGTRRFAPVRIGAYRYQPENTEEQQRLRVQYCLCEDQIKDIEEADITVNGTPLTNWNDIQWDYTHGAQVPTRGVKWFHDTLTEQSINYTLDDHPEEDRTSVDLTLVEGSGWLPASPYQITDNITSASFDLSFPDGLAYLETFEGGDGPDYDEYIFNDDFRFYVRWRPIGETSWTQKSFAVTRRNIGWMGPKAFKEAFRIESLTEDTYEFQFWVYNQEEDNTCILEDVVGYLTLPAVTGYTTNGSAIDRLAIGLYFPNGIAYINDNGEFSNHTVRVAINIRPYGESDWTINHIEEITRAQGSPFRKQIPFYGLTPDQYEVFVFMSGETQTSNRYLEDVVFEYLQEGIDQEFVYPGEAILSLDIPASNLISGSLPTVTVEATCEDYATGHASSNPAWAAYHRLINRYGVDASDIETAEFTEWATYCDTNSLTVGLYLDTQLDMQTVLGQIGIAGRAAVIQRGSKWGVIIDDQADPVQSFNIDDIIQDSFEETFLPLADRANAIVCWFYDADNDYRRTPVKIIDQAAISAGDDLREIEITLYGVTDVDQAIAFAMRMLNNTRLTLRTLSWECDISAINCRLGDVVYLQSDVPQWGLAAGRVTSATSTTVTCDIPQDFDDSENSSRDFRVIVRHTAPRSGEYTEFLEVLEITNPYPNTGVTTYSLPSGAFERTPEVGALVTIAWVTGEEESTEDEILSTKEVRITNIERSQDQTFKLTAVEYYDDCYIEDYIVELPSSSDAAAANNLSGTNSFSIVGRNQVDHIDLIWTGNAPLYYVFYRMRVDATTWGTWRFYRTTTETSISISDLATGQEYNFSVTTDGNPDATNAVTVDFQATDHVDIIEGITNLRCAATGDTTWDARDLDITWDAVGVFSLDYYKLEIYNAAETVVLRTEQIPKENPRFVYTLEMNAQDHGGTPTDSVKVCVTVVDVSENEQSSAITEFTNGAPDPITDLKTTTGNASAFTGRDVDLIWIAPSDTDLQFYEVSINHGGSTLRTEYVAEPRYIYTYTMNTEDGSGTPSNVVYVQVYAIDVFGNYSTVVNGTFTNNAPNPPSGLVSSPWMNGLEFNWTANSEPDISHYSYRTKVESEDWSSWVDVSTPARVFVFLDDTQTENYPNGATVLFQVVAVDTFGSQGGTSGTSDTTGSLWIPPTALNDFAQISGAFYEVPVLRDFTWTSNSPSAGYIAWSTGTIYYNGSEYSILANNTNYHYVLWEPEASAFTPWEQDSTLPEGYFIIAVNNGGTYSLAWNNAIANQVIGSAWIRDAAIISAKIANLAVTNAHINDLDGAKINAGTVTITGFDTTANAVLSRDTNNLVMDPDFSKTTSATDNTWWRIESGNGEWGSSYGYNSSPGLYLPAVSGEDSYTYNKYNSGYDFKPCIMGDIVYIHARVQSDVSFNAAFRLYVWTYDKDEAYLSSNYIDVTSRLSAGSWVNVSAQITIAQSNAAFFAIGCVVTGTGSAGGVYIDNIYASKPFPSNAPDNSICITGTFIGFHATGSNWPIRIQNDSGTGKFYCGDGSNIYIEFDGTDFNLQPSEINILAGKDINLIGSDSDPGKINFQGTSYTTSMSTSIAGGVFTIEPSSDETVSMQIGDPAGNIFSSIYLDAEYIIEFTCADTSGDSYSEIQIQSSGTAGWIDLVAKGGSGGTEITMTLMQIGTTGSYFGPSSNKVIDLGRASYAFDDAYADDWNNVADFFWLDEVTIDGKSIEVDDVKVINAIKPSGKTDDRTGMRIINDATLPPWLVTRQKSAGEDRAPEDFEPSDNDRWHWVQPGDRIRTWAAGQVAVDPDGKPYLSNKTMLSLLMGAVRRLDNRLQVIESLN